jgi:hypothetical protein
LELILAQLKAEVYSGGQVAKIVVVKISGHLRSEGIAFTPNA